MAAGEYVSVSSQSDTEQADLARERHELATQPEAEEDELTGIYVGRGLTPELARQVAQQLMERDALGAHARDELGLTEELAARPLQAAMASAATFANGVAVPILAILLAPVNALVLACIHRLAHHQGRDRLVWLYDIHLLAGRLAGDLSSSTSL